MSESISRQILNKKQCNSTEDNHGKYTAAMIVVYGAVHPLAAAHDMGVDRREKEQIEEIKE